MSRFNERNHECRVASFFAKEKSKKKKKPIQVSGNCFGCRRVIELMMCVRNGHENYCSKRCFKKNHNKIRKIPKQRIAKPRMSSLEFCNTREWRELRYKALRKYGFRCLACGAKPPDIVLHVDHIRPRSKYPELELSLDNLQVLCELCNVGKSNKFEDDLRGHAQEQV